VEVLLGLAQPPSPSASWGLLKALPQTGVRHGSQILFGGKRKPATEIYSFTYSFEYRAFQMLR
jgi:hypothetical protein